jgi:hypothetical protein
MMASCKAGPPQDCKLATEKGCSVLDRNSWTSEREALLACLPFSKPERVAGAWVYGFETNLFYEGERASRNFPLRASNTSLDLEADAKMDGHLRIYQVEIIGRRSQCDMGLPRNVVLVDRIISITNVGTLN